MLFARAYQPTSAHGGMKYMFHEVLTGKEKGGQGRAPSPYQLVHETMKHEPQRYRV